MARGYGGTGEAVVYNFGPLTQVALQQAAQKRAENLYLDRQIATEQAKLTPAGIRPQDVPIFLKQYQAVKDMSIRNRDAIRNPAKNPQAYQDYQNALGQLQATITESKGAKEMNKAAYGFYSKNAQKIDQDAFRAAAADFNAPIGTPEFERGKNYDITQAIWKPAQFDQGKWQTTFNAAVKPVERIATEELPTGQHRNTKTQYRDPAAIREFISQSYDNDLQHAKKFYDDQFEKMDDPHKQELEGYAKKYIPDFQINNGKDLAIAANMYGQVEKDMGQQVVGSPYKANQAFQAAQQQRSFSHQETMFNKQQAAKGENDKNYSVLPDMAKMLKAGRYSDALLPLEAATSGAQSLVLKNGRTPAASLEEMKRAIKANAIDSKTRTLTDEDYKNGVLVTMVPRMNPAAPKEILKGKDKNGKMVPIYDYMATPSNMINIEPRLQAHINFSANQKKPVKGSVFKNIYAQKPPTAVGALDFSTDDEQNETVPDTETPEEEQ
jgi:hypothetical protein